MGSYRQNEIPRDCRLCGKPILKDQKMMDFFRSSRTHAVVWGHETCVSAAIELWITKKETKDTTIQ